MDLNLTRCDVCNHKPKWWITRGTANRLACGMHLNQVATTLAEVLPPSTDGTEHWTMHNNITLREIVYTTDPPSSYPLQHSQYRILRGKGLA